jgi:broad-specificity NMP kinase
MNIIISGFPGEGKSIIAKKIKEALDICGITVNNNDFDLTEDELNNPVTFNQLNSLSKNNLTVNIYHLQTKRKNRVYNDYDM